MGLIEAVGHGPIALDTSIFIYLIEEHPRWLPAVEPLFRAIDEGAIAAITSALTLLEVLVVPLRAGEVALAEKYEALLTRGRGLRVVDLDRSVLRTAALVRAKTRARTPDCIQIAAALAGGCTALLTNDREFPGVSGLKILQLADFG